MTEQIINNSTAKLAKEVGFNIPSYKYYLTKSYTKGVEGELTIGELRTRGAEVDMILIRDDNYAYAPTQSLLQKWIREVHNIHINITTINLYRGDTVKFGGYRVYIASNIPTIEYEINSDKYYNDAFDTYEEALEDGLFETLKIIKTNKLNNK